MRKARGLLGIIVSSFLLLHAGGTIANADDHGNNGTIKVVSATDPGNDNDNDPKVCSFHIAGMNFDKSSSGTWSITGQGGNPGSGTASGTWAANASGAWQTANMTLPNGQYKVSAKQNGTPGGEKQKVFKVTCGQGTTGKAPETSTPSNNNRERARDAERGQRLGRAGLLEPAIDEHRVGHSDRGNRRTPHGLRGAAAPSVWDAARAVGQAARSTRVVA